MFEAWGEKCVWCGRPLFFDLMEVEHLLPKSLKGEERASVLALHGRDEEFDLNALENLAPSCGPCNRGKGPKPPPDAPRITLLLRTAEERAPQIRVTAERSRGSRRLRQAIAVVAAGVQAGDEDALSAVREAAGVLTGEFGQVTGRSVNRLQSALAVLADIGEFLRTSDESFFYPAATHPTDGPSPPETPGTVMSVSTAMGAVTSRIDVVPRDQDALARYGPQFTLSATQDESGERAAALLGDALRHGRPVEIDEGLDVTFDRMPPAFKEIEGKRISGTVRLDRPQRARHGQIPDWNALMRASTQPKHAAVPVLMRPPRSPPEGWDDALEGSYGGMTVKALWRHHETGGQLHWNFAHAIDRSPVRQQLRALEFLEALRVGADLIVVDRGKSRRPDLRMAGPEWNETPATQAVLALLRDLRVIEQWSDVEFDFPDMVTGEEAWRIAHIADLVRNQGRALTWNDAHMQIADAGLDQLRSGGLITIERSISATILGREVDLGYIQTNLAAYEIVSIEAVAAQPGQSDVRIVPTDSDAGDVFERLVKRSQRERKPPSSPRKLSRAKRKARRKKQ